MIKPLRFVLSISFVTIMLKKLRQNYFKLTLFTMAAILSQSAHANIQTIEVVKNNSTTITVPEKIKTMIIGNPAIAKTIVLKPDTLLVNGTTFGSTSLTLFGKSGASYEYKIHVTHDLTLLRAHLKKVDPRIIINTDLNSDAIVLSGVVSNQGFAERAEELATRFFAMGTTSIQLNQPGNPTKNPRDFVNATEITNNDGSVPGRQTTKPTLSSSVRIINLILTENSLLPAGERLEKLLDTIDPRIAVEDVNGVFMLKGNVKSPAALTRALSTADRFVSGGTQPPDFSVISDQGGVLAGNTDEEEIVNPVIPQLNIGGQNGQNGLNGGGQGGNQNGGGRGGNQNGGGQGGNQNAGGQGGGGVILSPRKGNLAQNIARGDVVMAANGRVMSTIKVDKNPRVEIQMRIVGVDRSKTEDMGIDWRLISASTSSGKTTGVSIGSLLGNVTDSLPGIDGSATGTINPGTSTLVLGAVQSSASRILSISSFLRWVETRGAAKTLTEPLLTALSGESATFNVGGTLPILTQDQTNTGGLVNTNITSQTITFLQYGLGIVVRPTVLENGKISIILDQTLSEPDYNVAVPVLSAEVPGFRTRTVNTITESADGETWAVAGLTNEDDTITTKSVPFLSNIPILGWLFKNENKGKSRRELLLVITARLVGDEDIQPSQSTENNITTEQLNQMAKQTKPEAPKQPAANNNAQSILQKQPSYSKPAKPKTPPPVESIP